MVPHSGAALRCDFLTDDVVLFDLLSEKIGSGIELLRVPRHAFPVLHGRSQVLLVHLSRTCEVESHRAYLNNLRTRVPIIAVAPAYDPRVRAAVTEVGAYGCWVEGGSIEELRALIRRASELLALQGLRELAGDPTPHEIIGGQAIAELVAMASRLSRSDVNVLITGESGTGKEAFARLLHSAGPRASLPFIPVACSSLPETLIESELFGHERGAFTGATMQRRGRFEEVGAGTLFLDEIAELSPVVQVKLLRVLQERTFERLGSSRPIRCLARIVFATNQDLRDLVRSGKFRLDLYYRLNSVQLELPPLRARANDIELLANTFLARSAARQGKAFPGLSARSLAILTHYPWPGNVRELQNAMEAAVALHDADVIEPYHLPRCILAEEAQGCELSVAGGTFDQEVRAFKRRLIERTLADSHNNKQQAARALGIARSSLHRLIDELGIHHGSDTPPLAS